MIVGFFLQVVNAVIRFIISLLPAYPLPTAVATAVTTAWTYINAVSWLLPVDTLLTVLTLAMVFHVAILVWRLLHLVGSYLRGR